jgi:hypothetical protein
MTARLENAVRMLSPQELARVTEFAESLAQAKGQSGREHLSLDWAGAAADAYPEFKSGVDAAHGAMGLIRESIEKGLSR